MTQSKMLSISDRAYRRLLMAYPPAFREEYGQPMAQLFRDCCRDAGREGGSAQVLRLWLRTLPDLARTALSERTSEASGVSSPSLVRWGSMASVFGGLLFALKAFWDRNDGPSVAGDVTDTLAFVPPLFFLAGLTGLYVRSRGRLGRLGSVGFTLAFGGASAGSVGELAGGWPVPALGLVALLIGLMLIGLSAISRRALRGWSALPLVIGLLGFAWAFTDSYGVVEAWARLIHVSLGWAFGLCWMLLGLALRFSAEGGEPPRPARG